MNPQGIYTMVTRGRVLERQMEAISNNLANVDTVGYKQDQPTFASIFIQSMGVARESDEEIFTNNEHLAPYTGVGNFFVTMDDMGKNFSQGRVVQTGNDLDFALVNRDGFFSVETPQGERFTRAGTFRLNTENNLVSTEGFLVNGKEGPLVLEGNKVEVSEDGSVIVDGERIGGIKIVTFPFPERLQKMGNSLFAPVDAENNPRILENVQLIQGSVESSNVDPVKEMVQMIQVNRAYMSMQRTLAVADEMNKGAISLAKV